MTSVLLINAALVLVAIEALVLFILVPRRWPHVSRAGVLATLAAGATLMLALRAVAGGASANEMAAWLLLALVTHLVDLGLRFATSARGDRHG